MLGNRLTFKHKSKIETGWKPCRYTTIALEHVVSLLFHSLTCLSAFKWLLISADYRHLMVMSDSSTFSGTANLTV